MLSPCFSSFVFVVVVFLGTIIQIWFQAYAKPGCGISKSKKKNWSLLLMERIFLLRDLSFRGRGSNRRHANSDFLSLPKTPLPDPPPGPPHDLSIGSGIANYGTLACVSQMGGIPTLSPSASSSSRRIIHFSFSSSEREKGKRGKGICLRNHHWTDVVLSIPLCDITFSSKSSYIDWGSPFSPLLFGARGGRAKEGSWDLGRYTC